MNEEIKRLKAEIKEWESQEVRERFEQVGSNLPAVAIEELKYKIKQLKNNKYK